MWPTSTAFCISSGSPQRTHGFPAATSRRSAQEPTAMSRSTSTPRRGTVSVVASGRSLDRATAGAVDGEWRGGAGAVARLGEAGRGLLDVSRVPAGGVDHQVLADLGRAHELGGVTAAHEAAGGLDGDRRDA